MEIKTEINRTAYLLKKDEYEKFEKHFALNLHDKGLGFILKVDRTFLDNYLIFIEEKEKELSSEYIHQFLKLDDDHLFISNRMALLLINKVFSSFIQLHDAYFKYSDKEEKEILIINGEEIETKFDERNPFLGNSVYGFYLLKFIINI